MLSSDTNFRSRSSNFGSEAATRDVLLKKVFLEISQNSQENTCVRVSFLIKLQASEHLFYGTHLVTTSIGSRLCQTFMTKHFAESSMFDAWWGPNRSINSQMFSKIRVLKNFAIFTGKHLCWSLSLIKLQAWRY